MGSDREDNGSLNIPWWWSMWWWHSSGILPTPVEPHTQEQCPAKNARPQCLFWEKGLLVYMHTHMHAYIHTLVRQWWLHTHMHRKAHVHTCKHTHTHTQTHIPTGLPSHVILNLDIYWMQTHHRHNIASMPHRLWRTNSMHIKSKANVNYCLFSSESMNTTYLPKQHIKNLDLT